MGTSLVTLYLDPLCQVIATFNGEVEAIGDPRFRLPKDLTKIKLLACTRLEL